MKAISPKDKKALKVVAIVLTLLAVGLGFWWGNRYVDGRRFADISVKKDLIVGGLIDHLDNVVVSSEPRNTCFNSGQGPYDNGKLWCRVVTVIKLDRDIDQREIGNEFIRLANSKGFEARQSNDSEISKYEFVLSNGVGCMLNAIASDGEEIGAAYGTPLTSADAPAIAVSCADRARARHYPYVN